MYVHFAKKLCLHIHIFYTYLYKLHIFIYVCLNVKQYMPYICIDMYLNTKQYTNMPNIFKAVFSFETFKKSNFYFILCFYDLLRIIPPRI